MKRSRFSEEQIIGILKEHEADWRIGFFLDGEGRVRDRALFKLAIDSKLRGCDLVKIKTGALVAGPGLRTRSIVIQQKTGRPVQFEIAPDARASLLETGRNGGRFCFSQSC